MRQKRLWRSRYGGVVATSVLKRLSRPARAGCVKVREEGTGNARGISKRRDAWRRRGLFPSVDGVAPIEERPKGCEMVQPGEMHVEARCWQQWGIAYACDKISACGLGALFEKHLLQRVDPVVVHEDDAVWLPLAPGRKNGA